VKWHIETRKLSELRDHPKNPRILSKFDEKHLTASIQRFGLPEPLTINTDGTIIGGHQRKRILLKLKYKEVECRVPESPLTDEEVDELNIRLNKNRGDWDYDVLANEWELLDLVRWGFDSDDLIGGDDIPPEEKEEEEEESFEECPTCGHKSKVK
jgi:site-specific DNA-methyltransferase (adenine-specific)